MSNSPGYNSDGDIDFSRYSAAQLYGVLQRIDAQKYPRNFANATAALAALEVSPRVSPEEAAAAPAETAVTPDYTAAAPVAFPPPGLRQEFDIAFGPKPGFITWLGPSRNDFRLVGSGSIAFDGPTMTLRGRRFGFILGLPLKRRVELKTADIFNVEREENVVRFDHITPEGKSRSVTFWLADSATAEKVVQLLPDLKMPEFEPQLAAHVKFEEDLETRTPYLPVTYGFAMMCVVMFVVTVSHGAEWYGKYGAVELTWGSNFGPLTVSGQWWRLFTYALLHLGIFHLLFNLWALVSFGSVAERLYGSLRYAGVCLVAAAAGGMMSVALQPNLNSMGASGVVFGILGALLVAHLRGEEAIPLSVRRSLRNSTLFFAAVALAVGFIFPGIDNAVHVGGLIAGTCLGLAFHSPRRVFRIGAPAVLTILIVATGFTLGKRGAAASPEQTRFFETINWFVGREQEAVRKWMELVDVARAGTVADKVLADRLESELLPFWREATKRFEPFKFEPNTDIDGSHQYMRKLTSGRLQAIELCESGLRTSDVALIKDCMSEMKQIDDMISARLKALEEGK